MSIQVGSPKIVTDGLVFYTDRQNPRFFLGPSGNVMDGGQINLLSDPDLALWSPYYHTDTNSNRFAKFTTEFGTIGYRLLGQASWNGLARGMNLPSTGNYVFSAWIRYLGGSPNNNGGAVYVSQFGLPNDIAVSIDKTKIGVWQKVEITFNATQTSGTLYIISWGGTDDAIKDVSSWEITMPQLERGTKATKYTAGSRNQYVVDLTGNTTVNATGMVYQTVDGVSQHYFDGTCYLRADSPVGLPTNGNATVLAWCKPSSLLLTQNAYEAYTGVVSYGSRGCGTPSDARLLSLGNNGTNMYVTSAYWCNDYYGGNAVKVKPDQWNYVAMISRAYSGTVGSGNVSLYSFNSDGGFSATGYSTSSTRGINSPSVNLAIGNTDYYNEKSRTFKGEIDIVQIYNRELTTAEIRRNYDAQRLRYGL